jgi:tetratricopeptide (TPR) repeat protein
MRHAPTTAGRGQVAGRLAEHYALRGRPAEALELCGQAKALGVGGLLAARLGAVECRALVSLADYQETLRAGRTALALLDTVPGARAREVAEITVRVYNATGQARRRLGDRVRAVEDLGQAVDTARAAGLRTLTGRALFGLAGVHVDMGKLDRGEACYAEALDVIRSVGDFHCLARTLHAQGVLRHYRGDPVGARALHEESLAVKRRIGDLGSLAISRIGLAQALLACGEVARAEELLTGPETIDDPWLRTHAVDTLAMIRMVADGGLSDPVRATLDEAGALAKSVGADPQLMAMIAVHTAVAEIAAGHADEAALLLAATPLADDYDVLPMEAEFVRGAIELVRGNRSGVRAAADRITDLVADGRPRMYLPAAQRLRAATHDAPPTSTLPRMLWVLTST